MKKILLFVLILSGLFAKQITGAFGIKLGDKLTNYKNIKIVSKSKNEDGTLQYYIIPSQKIKFLNGYFIKTSPINKIIYSIGAYAMFKNMTNCSEKLDLIKIKLESKYGKVRELKDFSFDKEYLIESKGSKGTRGVIFGCISDLTQEDAKLIIIYADMNLEKKAIKEAANKDKSLNAF